MALPRPPLDQAAMTYVDRPEIADTFVDALRRATFDGVNVRIEFTVNRLDDPQPAVPPTGKALTACRIIIPLTAFLAVSKQFETLVSTLHAKGVLRQIQNPPADGRPN
jgi:hypothetical protein